MAYAFVACRVLLLVVFGVSSLSKIRSQGAWAVFVRSIRDLSVVRDHRAAALAAGVVGGEATTVVLLAIAPTIRVGLAVAGVLLVTFTASILVMLRKGIRAPCRCFGSSALPLGRRHVVRNTLLLAVVMLGALSLASAQAPTQSAGLTVAAAAGLIASAVLIFFDELVELFVGPTSNAVPLRRGIT